MMPNGSTPHPQFAKLQLPDHLRERARWCSRDMADSRDIAASRDVVASGWGHLGRADSQACELPADNSSLGSSSDGDMVLYWMRTAVRVDENPALDVAVWVADYLGLPLLVYHGISDDYEYASDRHHRFMLEGARDVQEQFKRLGISYAFHLTTSEDPAPRLLELARKAACLITEDMPVDPPLRYLRAILRQTTVPTLVVDTACVVPMQVVGRAYTRAFEYRTATAAEYRRRVGLDWPARPSEPRAFPLESLPFRPLDLEKADLGALIARCRIDHAVGPILGTEGGSTAGYRRWHSFVAEGLSRYDQRRNSPLQNGVSRLSAYLHYGMVSPLRLAREAHEVGGAGAEKFLDELLIWRELAYGYCRFTKNYDQWESLPEWAQATLGEHARDPRPNLYNWEQLARGETNDELWNVAQQSLLMTGELHNNVRMTWGKAVLQWTATPQEALRLLIDLNHRYALDGRDPASYGGLLWCFGQFDRPFQPAQPIIGHVRPRPTQEHSQRLSVERYRRHVWTLNPAERPTVAVIGAGVAGLIAARTLSDHGWPVTVFEKSHGYGGRMATRRTDTGHTFDHGASYFTARDERFQRYVSAWQQAGVVAIWPDSAQHFVTLKQGCRVNSSESKAPVRYVGVPGMTALAHHLSSGLSVRLRTRVAHVSPTVAGELELLDEQEQGLGCFQRAVLALPAPQAAMLLDQNSDLARRLAEVDLQPCWATMASFSAQWDVDWCGAFLHESDLSWTSRNGTKPGRSASGESIVIHATPQWTRQNWESPPDEVATAMLTEFWRATGLSPQVPNSLQAHRWRYAIPSAPLDVEALASTDGRIVACGDWCSGARIEGAFLSGQAAAGRLLNACRVVEQETAIQLRLF
ncbi:MAG: FAD-dependent oxidoreductase [Planctomycetaceae bacterium]|nr:FAD-dependent oxidoreductase [Planctomycetaceae bacterium]